MTHKVSTAASGNTTTEQQTWLGASPAASSTRCNAITHLTAGARRCAQHAHACCELALFSTACGSAFSAFHAHAQALWTPSAALVQVVHSLSASKFFGSGWGDLSRLDPHRFSRLVHGVQHRPTEYLTMQWGVRKQCKTRSGLAYEKIEGTLEYLPPGLGAYVESIPAACKRGRVWLVRPGGEEFGPAGMSACVVQLAATGEQDGECATHHVTDSQSLWGLLCRILHLCVARKGAFRDAMPMLVHSPHGLKAHLLCRRREALTLDLLQHGVGTVILESPFYGHRRPPRQERAKLLHVADLIKLGALTIVEALWLVHMLRAEGVHKVLPWQALHIGALHVALARA